jgi:hypothetical protein
MIPLRVIAAEDERILSSASVHLYYRGREENSIDLVTDREGRCQIPVAGRKFRSVEATVDSVAYVPKVVSWFEYELESQETIPEYVLRLERGRRFGGLILDEAGQAVPGAKVTIGSLAADLSSREEIGASAADTDLEGRWTSDQIHAGVQSLDITVQHPDFAVFRTNLSLLQPSATDAVFVLRPGVAVGGVVVSATGSPVPSATVAEITHFSPDQDLLAITDNDGRFYFPHVLPGKLTLEARAAGFADGQQHIDASADVEDVHIVLTTQRPPPQDDGEPRIRLTGSVVDDETGLPVERFKALLSGSISITNKGPVPGADFFKGQPQFLGEPWNGGFDWNWPPLAQLGQFQIEVRAAGYVPSISDPLYTSRTNKLLFRLKKRYRITGEILTPDGTPAAGALVQLAGTDPVTCLRVRPDSPFGLSVQSLVQPGTQTDSDAQGKFALKPVPGKDRLLVLHDSGCAILQLPALLDAPIRLQPWGGVDAQLRMGPSLAVNQTVKIETCPADWHQRFFQFEATSVTGDQGSFAFTRLPPGIYHVFKVHRLGDNSSSGFVLTQHTRLEVRPGETTHLSLGGNGRTVVGQLRTQPDTGQVDWTSDAQALIGDRPTVLEFKQGEFGDLFCYLFNYYLQVQPDGSFVVQDVPPGRYELTIRLSEPTGKSPPGHPEIKFRREVGALNANVVIPETGGDQGSEPVDLGIFTVELRQ